MRTLFIVLFLLTFLMGNLSAQEEEIRIYASYSILADVVSQVAGDVISVRSLLPA